MNSKILFAIGAALLSTSVAWAEKPHHHRQPTEGAKLHKFSTTIERERPELNEETKALIAADEWECAAGRTHCRTEERGESRLASKTYPNVGFRVVRED